MLLPLLFLVALLDAAAPAMLAATDQCPYGCVLADDGSGLYRLTRGDVVWLARAAHCEVDFVIPGDEAQATLWALVQNHHRQRLLRPALTLTSLVTGYSACCSSRWATGGRWYHPRITPRADATRAMTWHDIPRRTRRFVLDFLRGRFPNRWPGWVYVFTRGWERKAARSWDGPYYAAPGRRGVGNAYWRDPTTIDWTAHTLRIVPGGAGLARLDGG